MKSYASQLRAVALAIASVVLIGHSGFAQTPNYPAFTFDATTGQQQVENQWFDWWGTTPVKTFDPGTDAGNSPTSGSMKVSVDYMGLPEDVCVLLAEFDQIYDGTRYTNVTFDIMVDPSSPITTTGNYMDYWQIGFVTENWDVVWLDNVTVPCSPGWLHVERPTDPTDARMERIRGLLIELWGEAAPASGTGVFWLDNFILNGDTNPVVPPIMDLGKTTSGLQLYASVSNQPYQTQDIRTQSRRSWVNRTGPVTYSLTIKSYPDPAHYEFETHFFLVPEQGAIYGPDDVDIDWDAENVVYLQILNKADGTATASFMYKTNAPEDDTMFWNDDPSAGPVGMLATLDNPTPLGTWTMTFTYNTNITLMAPSGASTSFTIPLDAAALFADPAYAYFGVRPNHLENIGQYAVLSSIRISGTVPAALNESFANPLNTSTRWTYVAYDPAGILVAPAGSAWWLNWTLPAVGFTRIETCSNLASHWTDSGVTNLFNFGGKRRALISTSQLPSADSGFFRVLKQ